jgi:hypothetical protein
MTRCMALFDITAKRNGAIHAPGRKRMWISTEIRSARTCKEVRDQCDQSELAQRDSASVDMIKILFFLVS